LDVLFFFYVIHWCGGVAGSESRAMDVDVDIDVHLFPTIDQSLLYGRDAFFLLDSFFDS
jgi:hypothetical protein